MDELISIDNLPSISVEEIHLNNLAAFAVGNRATHVLIAGIAAIEDTRGGWARVGSASAGEYGKKYFGYKRAMTHERIRVARKLAEIPALAAPFRKTSASRRSACSSPSPSAGRSTTSSRRRSRSEVSLPGALPPRPREGAGVPGDRGGEGGGRCRAGHDRGR